MNAITRALDAFQQCLDELGNDDHSVGLCDCEDRRKIAEARSFMAELDALAGDVLALVESHDEFEAALREIVSHDDGTPQGEIARAALTKGEAA